MDLFLCVSSRVFPRFPLCSSCSSWDPLHFVKDPLIRVPPCIIWYHEPRFLTNLEPPHRFVALFCCVLPQIRKFPTKNSPKNFVICWFDDILLILIRGFAWFQVDLAFPQVSPSFLHKIAQISPPKSSNSAHNSKSSSRFRSGIFGPDIRATGRTSGPSGRTSGSWRAKSRKFVDIRSRKSGPDPGCPTPVNSDFSVSQFCP